MASLLEELLQPISAESFCGDDCAYEPEFETAKTEAEKISENDWKAMEAACRKLLTKKSKDMRALGFMCLSTAMCKGLTPFAEAVQAYAKLVMEHWADIHPKRENGRVNALRWLNEERGTTLLAGLSNASGDYDALTAASEALAQLQTFCEGKFPGGSPAFTNFAKQVRQFAQNNKPREEAPAAETSAESTSSASAAGSGPGVISSFDDCLVSLQNAATFLQGQNPANPLAFRLSRIALWGAIEGNIPSEGGVTMLPPPYPTTLEAFQNLYNQAQWADLVKSGEESLTGDGMFLWLDLQRFICLGMKTLGGGYPACATSIMRELAHLLQRAPELPNQKYNDGTPFASAATQEWIETEAKASLGGGGGGGAPAIKKKGDVGEEQKQAFALMDEGKLSEALNVFRQGLANDSSKKNNFDRKLLLADLCFKANKLRISHAMLEDLRTQISTHDLENWDPESCLQVYRLTQKVALALVETAGDEGPALRTLAMASHAKISRLDPVLALQTDIPA